MQLNAGEIVEGKVVKITKFGAFVQIEPRVSGLVHISEISKQFVVDVSMFLEVGNIVKVKILNNIAGKLSLSIKQAQELMPKQKQNKTAPQPSAAQKNLNVAPAVCTNLNENAAANLSFEEMLSRFKKASEEKLSNIKRKTDNRRSSYSRRR